MRSVPVQTDALRPKIGLVLSGGGARGAYEIGVLRYVRERLPVDTRFDVITGTSVGAINGAYIAATCDRPKAQARLLSRVWSRLTIDTVYRFGWAQVRSLPRALFGSGMDRWIEGPRAGGLFDGKYLDSIVRRHIPWSGIEKNIRSGHLDSFAVSATELATGICTTFVQSRDDGVGPNWTFLPHEAVHRTRISASHTIASAAIPGLFPAVRIGEQLYVDGMLRLNTPLRPAIRLGADRLLVVALDHERDRNETHRRLREKARYVYPNAPFLIGKTLNSLLLDRLGADLVNIRRINHIIDAGIETYGPEFAHNLAQKMHSDHPFRKIETVVIQPSVDLGEIAWQVVKRTGLSHHEGVAAKVIRRSMNASERFEVGENDFASYVLFDKDYVRALIDLGFEDARRRHDELMELFCPLGAEASPAPRNSKG